MELSQNELRNDDDDDDDKDDDDDDVAQFVSDKRNIAENKNCWHES